MSDLTIITKLETLTPELKDEVNNFIDLLIEKSVRTCGFENYAIPVIWRKFRYSDFKLFTGSIIAVFTL